MSRVENGPLLLAPLSRTSVAPLGRSVTQFYLRVAQRMVADLKLPFQLGADLFRKGETEVHEAIREALVNALIHADYQGQRGIVVEKFPSIFEFANPGTLLVSFEQLLRGNVSECRNKALQTMFMLIGAGGAGALDTLSTAGTLCLRT